MARIRPGVIGEPSGKVGDVVYRRKNKKIHAYNSTKNRKRTVTAAVVKNESAFSRVIRFSNFINNPEIVKNVWEFSKLPGTYTNLKIFKHNYENIRAYGVTHAVHILPENYKYVNKDILIEKDSLTLNFQIEPGVEYYKKQTKEFSPPYYFLALVHAKNPVKKKSKHKEISVFPVEISLSEGIELNNNYSFSFAIPEDGLSFIDDYNTVIVFPAVVSFNKNNNSYEWAENGGFYVKGFDSGEILYSPVKPKPVSGKEFFVKKG